MPNLKVLCQTPKVLILLSFIFSFFQIKVNIGITTYISPAKIVLQISLKAYEEVSLNLSMLYLKNCKA